MHPAQASPLELIVSSSSAATRRPSVRSPPKRRPTCPRVRTPRRSDRGAHLTRVSTLSGPGTSPVSGQLAGTPGGRGQPPCPGFLLPFGRRPSLVGSSWSRPGAGPSSRSAYRAHCARTRTGFPRSAPRRYGRGGCPLYPGDGGALPAGCRARPSPAASQRPVPAPRCHIPPAGLRFTRHQRGFTRFTRPACPSPVASRMGRTALGLSPVLRTPPLPAAHDRAGPGVSTRPELRDRHDRPSNPRVHSQGATSCRNGRSGRSLADALARAG